MIDCDGREVSHPFKDRMLLPPPPPILLLGVYGTKDVLV
jgi:hypothetical protein